VENNVTRFLRPILATALTACVAFPAMAQKAETRPAPRIEIDAAALDRDTITIGGGVGYIPSYEGSNDYIVIPVGAVRGKVSGFNFMSRGLQLSVDAVRDQNASGIDIMVGPVAGLNLNRNNRIVDPQVRALGTRKTAVEVGGYVGLAKTGVITSDFDTLAVRVSYVRDVTGVHDSYVINPSIEYGTPLSRRAYVGIAGMVSIVGDGYAQTYFAVDPAGAAASGLPVFAQPRGGVKSYGATLLGNYALSGDLRHGVQLFSILSYSRLQGDFARSPITRIAGSADQFYGALGIGYTF
jgi:outer membrane scaffolding protein for murein synthesis (MipA/OmpV family)